MKNSVATADISKIGQLDPGEGRLATLQWYYSLIRGSIWLLVLATMAAGIGTYVYESRVATPTYEATATLQVDAPQGALITPDIIGSENYATTVAQLLDQYPVARQAYNSLHLHRPVTVQTLLNSTTASAVPNSQLVKLTTSSHDPALAARVANAMAKAGQRLQQGLQATRFSAAQSKLQAQIDAVRKDLNNLLAQNNGSQGNSTANTQIAADQAAIRNLQQKQLDLTATEAQSATTLTIPVPAVPPQDPVSPHPMRSALIVGFLAFFFTLGLFVLREYLTGTLRTAGEVAQALGGTPVLGTVLQLPTNNRRETALVTVNEPRTQAAEAYRIVRTNLIYANLDSPPQVILVTSAHKGEGKTTTAMNLAVSMADLDGRVLLIDADLRVPSLQTILDIDRSKGLTSSLLTDETVQSAILPTTIPNLYVMPSGPLPPNPAEVLSSRRMRELLDKLRKAFNVIVIDSPPLLAVADPVILSTMVDTVLFVVDAKTATRQEMRGAREALARVGSHMSGVVLNRIDAERGGYYYRYGYGPSEEESRKSSNDTKSQKRVRRKSASTNGSSNEWPNGSSEFAISSNGNGHNGAGSNGNGFHVGVGALDLPPTIEVQPTPDE